MTDLFDQSWIDYGDEAARLMEQYRPKFSKICRKWTYSQADFEDLYSDVVVMRLPRFIETWDPTKGDMMAYIFATVNNYCHKWVNGKKRCKLYPESPVHPTYDSPSDKMFELMETLDPMDQYLVYWRVVAGFTYKQLAEEVEELTGPQIKRRVKQALDQLKEELQ